MSLPLKRTLADIRSDIQIRLGYGMAGQAGVVNSQLIDSMIRSAQTQLYEQFDWLELKRVEERATGTDQQFYDYPTDCNIERITGIWVKWGNRIIPLSEGISFADRSLPNVGAPQKYERRDQLEIWPIPPNNQYTLRFEYIKTLNALNVDSDRVSLPSEIVYLHALSNAKAHYRQPDAQTYSSQLDAMLLRLKAKHRGKSVWGGEVARGPYDYVDSSQDV
jgi:hypothetical protein